ncbi:MAG TPA: ComEC/Rec2 family competence protein [Elusimicrobiota bacterium]|nr:ComEC/Rec2 family competence protein [Elusimicrobiota bacterium]
MKKSVLKRYALLGAALFLFSCMPQVRRERLGVIPEQYKPSDKELVVTFMDVGQGDSTFIRLPNGKTALVDGSGTPGWSKMDYDPGRQTILPLLRDKNVSKLDYVLLTHPHADHVGGLVSVLKGIPVGTFFDPVLEHGEPEYEELLELVERKKIDYRDVGEGDLLEWDPSVKVLVMNPPRDFSYEDINDNSVVLKIEYKSVSFLLCGDAETEAESRMVHQYKEGLKSHILKIGHHGSRTSSSARFIDTVQPEVGVIMCGYRNLFKHPHPETLSRLSSRQIKVFRTDEDGHIEIRTDGSHFSTRTYR